ncbi:hypothetical protein RCL1_008881 [Eukaryota sp. TZLM3-RCL]
MSVSDVEAYLKSQNFNFRFIEDRSEFYCVSSGSDSEWLVRFKINSSRDELIVYSQLATVPPPLRSQMGTFITLANYGLTNGFFELDYDDGELRFRSSLDVEHCSNINACIDNLLKRNYVNVDFYFNGIKGVLNGMDPTEAIKLCEEYVRS